MKTTKKFFLILPVLFLLTFFFVSAASLSGKNVEVSFESSSNTYQKDQPILIDVYFESSETIKITAADIFVVSTDHQTETFYFTSDSGATNGDFFADADLTFNNYHPIYKFGNNYYGWLITASVGGGKNLVANQKTKVATITGQGVSPGPISFDIANEDNIFTNEISTFVKEGGSGPALKYHTVSSVPLQLTITDADTCVDHMQDQPSPVDCSNLECDGIIHHIDLLGNEYICEFGYELTCNDWFDNDGDDVDPDNGVDDNFDCLDIDCDGKQNAEGQFCQFGGELNCADEVDNDFDLLVDCADSDCDRGLCSDNNDLRCINENCLLDTNNDGIDDNEVGISCVDNDIAEGGILQYFTESSITVVTQAGEATYLDSCLNGVSLNEVTCNAAGDNSAYETVNCGDVGISLGYTEPTTCVGAACVCIPVCIYPGTTTSKECGDDGCGGSCGTCAAGQVCNAGVCGQMPIPAPLYNLIFRIGSVLEFSIPHSTVDTIGYESGASKIIQVARIARALRNYYTEKEVCDQEVCLTFEYDNTGFSDKLSTLNDVLIETLSEENINYPTATKDIVVALNEYYSTPGVPS